ncbi:hypothetical protein EE612_036755, partial [Oryza sativa]
PPALPFLAPSQIWPGGGRTATRGARRGRGGGCPRPLPPTGGERAVVAERLLPLPPVHLARGLGGGGGHGAAAAAAGGWRWQEEGGRARRRQRKVEWPGRRHLGMRKEEEAAVLGTNPLPSFAPDVGAGGANSTGRSLPRSGRKRGAG